MKYMKGTQPLFLRALQLINMFNLLSRADGNLSTYGYRLSVPVPSNVLSAVADGSLLMPFLYTLLVVSETDSCTF